VPKNSFDNHRENVRKRFMTSRNSLGNYEVLEMLLFLAIPRKDTKAIAKLLLSKFGSLDNVLNADVDQLRDVKGIGNNAICTIQLFHEIILRITREELEDDMKTISLDRPKLIEKYCIAKIGHLVHEEVLVLFLNGSMKLVAEDIIGSGNASEAKIYNNILITRATQNGATGIILVHNHPSGNAIPSEADIDITENLLDILRGVGLKFVDHMIVTRSKCFSFRKVGLLLG
jgi:DNA repair protein RadC